VFFSEGNIEDEVNDMVLIFLEEGTAEVSLLNIVVEVDRCSSLVEKLAA
jgi:hypothetical protein